jgi:hypothetical protein
MNAAEEFLNVISEYKRKVICASIVIDWDSRECGLKWLKIPADNKKGDSKITLKMGYSTDDFKKFLEDLDFQYDSGFGYQVIFGYIWCEDGSWFERKEYDGSENWVLKQMPLIPFYLIPEIHNIKNVSRETF